MNELSIQRRINQSDFCFIVPSLQENFQESLIAEYEHTRYVSVDMLGHVMDAYIPSCVMDSYEVDELSESELQDMTREYIDELRKDVRMVLWKNNMFHSDEEDPYSPAVYGLLYHVPIKVVW